MKKILTIFMLIIFHTFMMFCRDPKKDAEVEDENKKEVYTDIVNNVYVDERQLGETEDENLPFPEISDDDFINKRALVSVNGKYGFINENRELVIDPVYDKVGVGFVTELARVCIDDKWGYIDKDGEVIIDFQYDYASEFGEDGFAEVNINNEHFKIDKGGSKVLTGNTIVGGSVTFENFNYRDRQFLVEKSNLIIRVDSKKGESNTQKMSYSNGRRNVIITKTSDNAFMWNIPLNYSGGVKTSLVVVLSQATDILTLGIASNDAMLTRESWDEVKLSPVYIKRNGPILQQIVFHRNWDRELVDNKLIDLIRVSKGGYVNILEKDNGNKATDETKINPEATEKPKIKVVVPKLMVVDTDRFVRAHVLNVIDFDIKLDISLLEVSMLGSRCFVQLLGLKNPYNKAAIKYLEDTILYKDVYVESDPIIKDNYGEYRYLRYVWTDMPEVVYNKKYSVDTISKDEVYKKLLNYKMVKDAYVYPRHETKSRFRYQSFLLQAFNDADYSPMQSKDGEANVDSTDSNLTKEKKSNTESANDSKSTKGNKSN